MAETIQEPSLTEQHTKPSTENFHATFHGVNVFFKLIKLKNSCFLWIGDDAKRMDCLSVALPNPFDKAPLVTTITDRRTTDAVAFREEGTQIASKLSKKLNVQVFVTYNVSATSGENDLLSSIEMHLFSLIRDGVKFTL